MKTMDIIDEHNGKMMVLPNSIKLSGGTGANDLEELPMDSYKIMYDDTANRMVCSIDLTAKLYDYYRLEYDVSVFAMPGTSVMLTNKAYVAGMKSISDTNSQSVVVQSSSGSAQGHTAGLTLYKYNADNLRASLAGAEFKLSIVTDAGAARINNVKENQKKNQAKILGAINTENHKKFPPQGPGWDAVITGTTDEDGKIVWENGKVYGSETFRFTPNKLYRLEETKPPQGYAHTTNNVWYFYVSVPELGDGVPVWLKNAGFEAKPLESVLYISNSKGNFSIRKVDARSKDLLPGAEFGLYRDEACTDLVSYSVETNTGICYFGDLDMNTTFYLKETLAPEEYELDETVRVVRVDASGGVTIDGVAVGAAGFQIVNWKIGEEPTGGLELPNTGGIGAMPFVILGAIAICASAPAFVRRRKDD